MTTKPKQGNDEEENNFTSGIPTRLNKSDYETLKALQRNGQNMSDLIRRCVSKALPEVAAEIAAEISRIAKKS